LQLRPKQLQSEYLYDALRLTPLEAICQLPWYRITRAETRLLKRYADGVVAPLDDPCTIVELGCGSGTSSATVAQALRRRGSPVLVHLIDISATALELSERTCGSSARVDRRPSRHLTSKGFGARRGATRQPSASSSSARTSATWIRRGGGVPARRAQLSRQR